MEIEYNVDVNEAERRKYNFEGIRNGASIWCEDNNERINILKAWKRHAKATGSKITATSVKVGPNDPKGEGYRILFKEEKPKPRPLVLSHMPKISDWQPFLHPKLHYTGIFTDEDIVRAFEMLDPVPQTVREMNAFRLALIKGETEYQIQYCRQHGKPTLPEEVASWRAEQRQREEEMRQQRNPLELHDRQGFRPWSDLTDEERRTLRREALVESEQEYVTAMRSCHPNWSNDNAFAALLNGYAPFTTWKRNEKIYAQQDEMLSRFPTEDEDDV